MAFDKKFWNELENSFKNNQKDWESRNPKESEKLKKLSQEVAEKKKKNAESGGVITTAVPKKAVQGYHPGSPSVRAKSINQQSDYAIKLGQAGDTGVSDWFVQQAGGINAAQRGANPGGLQAPGRRTDRNDKAISRELTTQIHDKHQQNVENVLAWQTGKAQESQAKMDKLKEGLNDYQKWGLDFGYTAAQMGLDLGASALMGGGSVPFLTTMGIRSYGASYQQAKKDGASDQQASIFAMANAGKEILSEKIFAVGGALKTTMGKGLIDVEKLLKLGTTDVLKSSAGREIVQAVGKFGLTATTEGAEEFVAGMVEPVLRKYIYSDEQLDLGEMLKSSLYDASIGAALGAGFGAVDVGTSIKTGQILKDNDTMSAVVDTGLASKENTKAYQMAAKLAKRMSAGIKPTAQDLNALHRENQNAIAAEKSEEQKARKVTDAAIAKNYGPEFVNQESDIEEMHQYYSELQRQGATEDVPVSVAEYSRIRGEVSNAMSEKLKASGVEGQANDADVTAISRILMGQGSTTDYARLYPANAIAREVFTEYTGMALPDSNMDTRSALIDLNEKKRVALADIEKNPQKVMLREDVIAAYERAGKMGVPIESVARKYGNILSEADAAKAYENGQNKAVKKEEGTAEPQAKKNKSEASSNPAVGFHDMSKTPEKSKKYDAIEVVSKKMGFRVELHDELPAENGKMVNGYYDPKTRTIKISKDATNPLEVVFSHELWHHLKNAAPKEAQALEDFVRVNMFSNDPVAFGNELARYKSLYGDRGDDFLMEELMADKLTELLSDPELTAKLAEGNPTLAQKIHDFINQFIDSIKAIFGDTNSGDFFAQLGIKEEAVQMLADTIKGIDTKAEVKTENAEPKYQISSKLKTNLTKVLNNEFGENEEIYIGTTSNFLSDNLEMEALVMTMPVSKAYASMVTKEQAIEQNRYRESDEVNYHGLTVDGLTKSLVASEKPIAAFASSSESKSKRLDRIVLVTDVTDSNGDNVVVVEQVSTKGLLDNKFIPVNKIITSYGKTLIGNMINDAISENRIMYVDKEKISNLSVIPDLQLVNNVNDAYLKSNIDHFWENVNYEKTKPKEKPYEPATATVLGDKLKAAMKDEEPRHSLADSEGNALTPEQAEFFKDSKVRDEQGRLLKVYHGTMEDFTVFDSSKGRANMDIQGNFFSPWEIDAKGYGGNVKPYYLNIKNPADESTGYTALRKFQGQNYAGIKAREYLISLGYDGVNNGNEEFITFEPNQIKSTYNLNPTEDDDIRYQLQEQQDENQLLIRQKIKQLRTEFENEKLAERGLLPDQAALNRVQRELRENYKSDIKPSQLAKELTDIFGLLKTKDADLEAAAVSANALAKEIINQGGELNNQMAKEYKALKEYMRTKPLQIMEEHKGDFGMGEFNRFRKANFGRLKLTKDGQTMDQFYPEMLDLFPGLLDPSITHPTDQLKHVLEVMKTLEPAFVNYDSESYAGREMVDILTLAILDSIFEINPVKPLGSNARRERYSKILMDIDKAVGEYAQMTEDGRAQEKQRYQDMISELETSEANRRIEMKVRYEKMLSDLKAEREQQIELIKLKGQEKLEKQAEMYRERINKTKARYQENKSRSGMMSSIKKDADFLAEALVSPTDAKHIPEGYRVAVATLLAGLDFESTHSDAWERRMGFAGKRVMNLRKLAAQYQKIIKDKDSSYIEPDESIADMLLLMADQVDGRRLSDLDNSELANVRIVLKHLRHAIGTINKTFNERIKETYSELGESIIKEMNGSKVKNEKAGWLGIADDFFNEDTVTPSDFFAVAGGTLQRLYYEVRKGFDNHIVNSYEAMQYIEQSTKDIAKKDVKGWSQKYGEAMTFTLESGQTIRMLPSQVMSLYALNRREQARSHLYMSGIVVASLEAKKSSGIPGATEKLQETHRRITANDMNTILSSMTEDQMKLANRLLKFISTTTSEWGNETSMKLYGYRKFTETNYFPIKSSDAWLKEQFEDHGDAKIKNLGFTKNTIVNASNPIVIDDFFTVITDHINKMSMYNALVPALTDFERVYNFNLRNGSLDLDSVKKSVVQAMGQKGGRYITKLMKNINGYYNREYGMAFADKLLAGFKKSALGLNMRVLVQQPTSLLRSAMLIDHKFLLEGMAQKTIGNATRKEMWEHVPIARWKSWGFAQTDVSREQKDIMMGNTHVMDKITMGAYGFADDVSWTVLYAAVKAETKEKYPDLQFDTPEYWEHVVDRFNEIVDRTQVVDSVFHRADIMRDRTFFKKTITSFMAEPLKMYNIFRTELILSQKAIQEGRSGDAAKIYARIGATMVPYFVVLTTVQSVMDAIRRTWTGDDDDDDKTYLEMFWAHFKDNLVDNTNPLTWFPVLRDIWSMYRGYEVKRPDLATLSSIIADFQRLIKYYKEDDSKYNMFHVYRKTIEDLLMLKGWPLRNLNRELESGTYGVMTAMGYPQYSIYLKNKIKYKVVENKGMFIDLYLKASISNNPQDARAIYNDLKKSGITERDITNRIKDTYSEELKKAISEGLIVSAEQTIDKMAALGMPRSAIEGTVTDQIRTGYRAAIEANDSGKIEKFNELLKSVGWSEEEVYNYEKNLAKSFGKYQVYLALQSGGWDAAYQEALYWTGNYPDMYVHGAEGMVSGTESSEGSKEKWEAGDW